MIMSWLLTQTELMIMLPGVWFVSQVELSGVET